MISTFRISKIWSIDETRKYLDILLIANVDCREADIAFFKGQKEKLEAELKEKREEVERMGRTDNGRIIEYVERELGRRLDEMTAINRDIARQRDQMEME